MATVSSNIALRDAEISSDGMVASLFNAIHDVIIRSGMIEAADDEYLGQAKVFSATDGVGFTKVVRNTALIGNYLSGYKVYRHPSLSLYIKINFFDVTTVINSSTVPAVEVQFSTAVSGGTFENTKYSDPIYSLNPPKGNSSYKVSLLVLPLDSFPLVASCGVDHFWLSRKQGLTVRNQATSFSFPTNKVDPLTFGVFAAQNRPNVFCVVFPQMTANAAISIGFSGEPVSAASSSSGLRYIAYTSESSWQARENGAAGSLVDAGTPNTENGIRVVQAELVVGGLSARFNFGFLSATVLAEHSIAYVNLNGVEQRYIHLPAAGSAGNAPPSAEANKLSTVIFPMVD